jgi:uncharacterized protein
MIELSIKIRDIEEGGPGEELAVTLSRALLKEALDGMDADLTHSRVDVRLNLSRTGDNVFARGALSGEVILPCVRCLGEARVSIDVPLKLTITSEELLEDDVEEDVDYFTHDGERVELADVIREAVILAAPMTALCRPDCQGLCPVCGVDRNVKECGCAPAAPDPRLAGLKGLKL